MEKQNLNITNDCYQNLESTIDEMGILMDLKVLIKEYYLATFSENGNSLDLAFNNGQKFRLTVDEI